jgi:hypothetical protein
MTYVLDDWCSFVEVVHIVLETQLWPELWRQTTLDTLALAKSVFNTHYCKCF